MSHDSTHLPGCVSAVVLYENLETGKRAQHVFQQLAHETQFRSSWNTSYWILNLLAIPSVQTLVAQDVSLADVVVLVLEDENELPSTVLTCLHASLEMATQPKTVVALLGFCPEHKRNISPVKLQLESLTAKVHKTCRILRTELSQYAWEEPQYESDELRRAMAANSRWSSDHVEVSP